MGKNWINIASMGLAAVFGGVASYWFIGHRSASPTAAGAVAQVPARTTPDCAYTIVQAGGFKRVKLLLYSEPMCESARFDSIRQKIGALITQLKANGRLSSASVYLRDFKKGEWTWYNGDELYEPGALMDVPLVIAWLARSEKDPDIMERTYSCDPRDLQGAASPISGTRKVQLNHAYSVRQLLELVIVHGDDAAASMLRRHLPSADQAFIFADPGFPQPGTGKGAYMMNVRDYSTFMKSLYHASMLSPMDANYAFDLMARATFSKGLAAGLPAGVEIAHRPAVAGDAREKQLHETGLVYDPGNPYLITVMTRGSNVDSLASAIAAISKLVHAGIRTP